MCDIHRCSICGKPMCWFMQTLLCSECDWVQIWELTYDYNVKKGRIENE